MDEVSFDFSFLKKYKARNKKKATLFLAIGKDGIVLKPCMVFCPNIEPEKDACTQGIITSQTETGDSDAQSLSKWLEHSLLPYTRGTPSLLILQSDATHRAEEFGRELREGKVEVLWLPKGVSCIMNPLRRIIPLLVSLVMDCAKQSDCANRKHKRVKQAMVNRWVMDTLKRILSEKAEMFYTAFDCLT